MTRPPAPTSCKVAIEAPLKQIAINAGLEGGVVVGEGAQPDPGPRPQRGHRRVRRHDRRGHHRPRQGDPLGPAERRLHRGAVPHHRGRRGRQAREGSGHAAAAATWAAWAAWTSESCTRLHRSSDRPAPPDQPITAPPAHARPSPPGGGLAPSPASTAPALAPCPHEPRRAAPVPDPHRLRAVRLCRPRRRPRPHRGRVPAGRRTATWSRRATSPGRRAG